MINKTKEQLRNEISGLHKKVLNANNMAEIEYLKMKIFDLISELKELNYSENDLARIEKRLTASNSLTKIYEYDLAKNLIEQKTIIADSISSSPMHLKKLELKNVIINYPEEKA